MSMRALARLGATLSIAGNVRIGSGDSDGEKVIQLGTGANGAGNTYLDYDTDHVLTLRVNNARSATFESDGGILHGSWNVEAAIVTSDRRLKTNIEPLQRTLREVVASTSEKKAPAGTQVTTGSQGSSVAKGDGALWLLRQLRPVSYSFRKGADSKHMRFGFIADELESVVPQVVRRPGDREVTDQKAVVYQDLIALLASASQSQQSVIEKQQGEVLQLKNMQNRMMEKLLKLEEDEVAKKEAKKKKRLRRRRAKDLLNETNATNDSNETNMTNVTNATNTSSFQI
jgi:hypothetical protein